MFDKPTMEIPSAVRQMAESNVDQTRQAYSQFMMFVQQANLMMMGTQGDNMRPLLDVQGRALRLAQDNIEASFRFASELARAKDIGEYADIQKRYAEDQVRMFQQQNEELGRIMADLARKITPT